MTNLTIDEIIGYEVQNTAEWRRSKAEQFPDDARNMKAAEQLDRLSEEIADLEGSEIHRQIDELMDLFEPAVAEDLVESVSVELRDIGFHTTYENGAKLLEWYHENLKTLLVDHINNDDSSIAPPNLKEQIENEPKVIEAKRRYEEARAEAFAEARKRL